MKIEAGKIKSWVERVERLLAERVETNGAIRDIYAEVKSNEHDAKAIRKLIQRRAMDPADLALQDDMLTAYTDAIAGKIRALDAISRGATTKEAAKVGGISTGSVSALASVQKSRIVNVVPGEDARAVCQPPLPDAECGVSRAGTSTKQEALAAGEEDRSAKGYPCTVPNTSGDRVIPNPSPTLPDGCSTDVVSMQHEIGAVAEGDSPQRVATDEIDLTPPPRLLAKRREIEERRRAT